MELSRKRGETSTSTEVKLPISSVTFPSEFWSDLTEVPSIVPSGFYSDTAGVCTHQSLVQLHHRQWQYQGLLPCGLAEAPTLAPHDLHTSSDDHGAIHSQHLSLTQYSTGLMSYVLNNGPNHRGFSFLHSPFLLTTFSLYTKSPTSKWFCCNFRS